VRIFINRIALCITAYLYAPVLHALLGAVVVQLA
jgi:hypothetical protein